VKKCPTINMCQLSLTSRLREVNPKDLFPEGRSELQVSGVLIAVSRVFS